MPGRNVALCAILWVCGVSGEDLWNHPNIVLDSGEWKKIRSPFFDEGDPRPHPPPKTGRTPHDKASVVILIAALHETKVVASIKSAFEWANNADRVFVGVVQQNGEQDEDALEGYCKYKGDH